MFCKKCGKQIEDNSKFCDYCGASTADESNQVQQGQIQGESPRQNYPPQQGYVQQQPGPVQQQGYAQQQPSPVQQQGYVQQQPGYVQQPGYPSPQNTRGGVTELVLGIISIVLSVIIFIQSILVGIGEAIFDSDSGGGGTGIVVSIFALIAGIVGLATRKSDGKGGAITAGVLYFLAALIGFSGAGDFSDLIFYAVILLIFGAVFIVSAVKRN
jgi:hypothetical protein